MRICVVAMVAGLAVPAAAGFQPLAGGGSAGNAFGDDRLTYQDGVVYDDDLVPGRGPNQPFLVEEQSGAGARERSVPRSPDRDPRLRGMPRPSAR